MSTPNWLSQFKRRKTTTSEEVNKQKALNRAAWSNAPALVLPKVPTANNMIVQQRLRNRLAKGNRPTRYGVNWMTRRANPRMSPLNPRFTRANVNKKPNRNFRGSSTNLTNENLYN